MVCGEQIFNQVLLNQVYEMTKEIIREGSLKYQLIVNTGRQGFKESLKHFDKYNHFITSKKETWDLQNNNGVNKNPLYLTLVEFMDTFDVLCFDYERYLNGNGADFVLFK
jgi:hypothetical protein